MPIITLTTDFGLKDHFVAAVKGAIFSELEDIPIVDISHLVSPFHITEAAYIIQNAYKSFPKGTIHIVGVDSELTPENKHLALFLDGHYFLCADNGIMSLITQHLKPDKIVEITIHDTLSSDFPVLDVFVKVATHLARGGSLDVIGKKIAKIKEIKGLAPAVNLTHHQIVGSVLYIDNYGNVVSNITKKLFHKIGKGNAFTITARTVKFKHIYSKYSDAIDFNSAATNREEDGKKIAIWNSSGYLELAIYKSNPHTVGSASTLFGLHFRDAITIDFESP